jgi:hypothetical protein
MKIDMRPRAAAFPAARSFLIDPADLARFFPARGTFLADEDD